MSDNHPKAINSPNNNIPFNSVQEIKKINPRSLFKLQNELIDLGFDLGNTEHKIVQTLFSMIWREKKPLVRYRVKITDVMDVTGLSQKTIYRELRDAIKGLNSKPVTITSFDETGKTKHTFLAWAPTATYVEGEGYIELQLHPELEKYILEIDKMKGFTDYALIEFLGFKHHRSFRMYQILKRWMFSKDRAKIFTLDELRRLFNVEGQYPLYADLKKRIIDPAKDDIKVNGKNNEFTFDYEEIRESRKVVKIKFLIKPKPVTDNFIDPYEEFTDDSIQMGVDGEDSGTYTVLQINQDAIKHLLPRLNNYKIKITDIEQIGRRLHKKGYLNVFIDLSNPLYFETILNEIDKYADREKKNGTPIEKPMAVFYGAIRDQWGIPRTEYEVELANQKREFIARAAAIKERELADHQVAAAAEAEISNKIDTYINGLSSVELEDIIHQCKKYLIDDGRPEYASKINVSTITESIVSKELFRTFVGKQILKLGGVA